MHKIIPLSILRWNLIPLLVLISTHIHAQQHIRNNIYDSLTLHKYEPKYQEDTIELEKVRTKAIENYQSSHKWRIVPTNYISLRCQDSDCTYEHTDSIVICGAIRNDTIFYIGKSKLPLGFTYASAHYARVPESLKSDNQYQLHLEAFKDSLARNVMNKEFADEFNIEGIAEGLKKIKQKAPYGFFQDWGWDDEFSVSFKFNYFNTNKKTIKYIDVYWTAKNDVGDVRGKGHFKGTGPLKYMESASWEWEYSHYYLLGDASTMRITKVILTYMNGTQKTLTGNMIVIDDDDE